MEARPLRAKSSASYGNDQCTRCYGIGFESLRENIDTAISGGNLVFHIFGALAEFGAGSYSRKTQAGLAVARAKGRTGGRPKSMNEKQIAIAKALRADPDNTIEDNCEMMGVSRPTLYRYLDTSET